MIIVRAFSASFFLFSWFVRLFSQAVFVLLLFLVFVSCFKERDPVVRDLLL